MVITMANAKQEMGIISVILMKRNGCMLGNEILNKKTMTTFLFNNNKKN